MDDYRDKQGVIPPEHFDNDMPPPDKTMTPSEEAAYRRLSKRIAEQQESEKKD